tara:strand:- start:62 stop:631 length:570 start_codon:yes stop_codon:yes gene_type:complete
MNDRITNLLLLILVIFLQSCSGGKIGALLESSFKSVDIKEKEDAKRVEDLSPRKEETLIKNSYIPPEQIINKKKILNKDNLSKNKLDKNSQLIKSNLNKNKIKIDENIQLIKSNPNKNKIKIPVKEIVRKYKPRSYRVIVIINNVDSSFPTENFSRVLRNSSLNFEIEKVERIIEQDKNLKKDFNINNQ